MAARCLNPAVVRLSPAGRTPAGHGQSVAGHGQPQRCGALIACRGHTQGHTRRAWSVTEVWSRGLRSGAGVMGVRGWVAPGAPAVGVRASQAAGGAGPSTPNPQHAKTIAQGATEHAAAGGHPGPICHHPPAPPAVTPRPHLPSRAPARGPPGPGSSVRRQRLQAAQRLACRGQIGSPPRP